MNSPCWLRSRPTVRPGVADQAVEARAEAEAEADDDPQQADDPEGDEALQHRRDHVLGAYHPGVEEGEARSHQKHQPGGSQEPGGVAQIDGPLGDRRRLLCGGQRADGQDREDPQRDGTAAIHRNTFK